MFGLFSKKKKPQNLLDEMIFSIYGNPPPAKRANLGQAVAIADELLMGIIDEKLIMSRGIELNDGPVPYSTHDLGLSIAVGFFQEPEYMTQLSHAQLVTRMQMLEWAQQGLVASLLCKSYEATLYRLYKPQL